MVFKNSKTTLRFSFLILYMSGLYSLILYCLSALNWLKKIDWAGIDWVIFDGFNLKVTVN